MNSLPTKEEICSDLVNLIKGKRNVGYNLLSKDPFYFMKPEEREKYQVSCSKGTRGAIGFRGPPGPPGTEDYKKFVEEEIKLIKKETIAEIRVKLPKEIADERRKTEISNNLFRSNPELEPYVLYEMEEIIRLPYFDKVFSILKDYNPTITVDDLLYTSKQDVKVFNELFGYKKQVKYYDPFYKYLIFHVAYIDFVSNRDYWEAKIQQLIS